MALYTTCHMHNVPAGREDAYATWFTRPHRESLSRLRGFRAAERYEVTAEQLMADIVQPWRYVSVYDFDLPDEKIDVPALGPLIAEARDAEFITADESERLFTYALYSDWKGGANWRRDEPLSGVSVLFGNYVAGRRREYDDWYENTHSIEVTEVPGHVAIRRGQLAAAQVEPRSYCPGDQLVMVAQQTDNLAFTIQDFQQRAMGTSPSGITMKPRSKAGSIARTVHYFRRISGERQWPGGIAYAGDFAAYTNRN
jgi:hypothetical protein